MSPAVKKISSPVPSETAATERPPTPDVEAVNPSRVIIIQPGSLHLKLGFASDHQPKIVPHCIAYRQKPNSNLQRSNHSQSLWFERSNLVGDEEIIQRGLRQAEDVLLGRPLTSGQYRQPANTQQILEFNNASKGEASDVFCSEQWTETSEEKLYFIGEEAINLSQEEPYDITWPFQYGRLNLHNGVGGSLSFVLQATETLWTSAISIHLAIPCEDFKDYNVVLLLPDLTERQHMKELMNVVLNRMKFGAAFIHQESVMACLANGLSSACIVDIGDQKTSVCCVDEGISLTSTRLSMDYGGSDITRCFYWLLCNNGFPCKECNLKDLRDCLFLQEMKETHCTLNQDEAGIHEHLVQHKIPSRQIINYKVQFGDECLLAPLAIFFPGMFGLKQSFLTRTYNNGACDPEDPWDDEYIQQTQSKQEQSARILAAKKKGINSEIAEQSVEESINIDDMASMPSPVPDKSEPESKIRKLEVHCPNYSSVLPDHLMGLTDAILYSIDKCETDEVKKKMYSCIIVTGGGYMFEGTQTWIQNSIWLLMPAHYRKQLETMDVITKPKDIDATMISWKGASIMMRMASSQELWVEQAEWNEFGLKVLRERLPFV